MDKQLSKRLKKLVKQWQLLLQSRVPNGIAPPTPKLSQQPSSSSQPLASPLNSYDSGYGSQQSTHITPSPPTDPSHNVPPSSSVNDAHHLKTNSSSNNSFSAMDNSSKKFSRGNSRDSNSPTPPTSSSHPGQVAPLNTTKNRIQMMQKLSGVKSKPVSPNKATINNDSTAMTSSSKYISPPSSHTSQINSHSSSSSSSSSSSVLYMNMTAQSHDPLPSRGVPFDSIESGVPGDSDFKSWTSSSFTEVSSDTVNGTTLFGRDDSPMVDPSSLGDAYCRNSRKRARMSDSPSGEVGVYSMQQPHKRHKADKIGSKEGDRKEMRQFLIRVPLDKVCIGRFKTIREGQGSVERNISDSKASVLESKLIVSFQRAKLNKFPMFWDKISAISDGRNHDEASLSSRTATHHRVHSSPTHHHPLQSHSGHYHPPSPQSQEHGPCNNDLTTIQERDNPDSKHLNGNTDSQEEFPSVCARLHDDIDDHTPTHQKKLSVPQDAFPGISGCVGLDGYWYDWTDHICSHDDEVTILPYVYIEDS